MNLANVEHSTLTTTNLHENKGVSTATDNTVATAVTGATVWAKLTASNLTGTGNSFGAQLLQVQHQEAANTASGSFTSLAFRTRKLTTTLTNEIGATVNVSPTNTIVLLAGTYWVEIQATAFRVNEHKARFRNITDAVTPAGMVGTSQKADSTDISSNISTISGRLTIAGTKTFELQHFCRSSNGTDGFGPATTGSGEVEVYADIKIWKII